MSAVVFIAHEELGSAQASIDFTTISQDYSDLWVVVTTRHESNVIDGKFEINSSGGNRYAVYVQTTATATSITMGNLGIFGARSSKTAQAFSNGTIRIPNYTSSTNHAAPVWTVEGADDSTAFLSIMANLTNSGSAVSTLSISSTSGNLSAGSSATLYGILASSDGVTTVS